MTQAERQFLQLAAAFTMLIDHIGAMFFPQVLLFRAVGRLSFPLFACGIAQGVAHTHSFPRYLGRLLLAAVLSQPVYLWAFGTAQGNPLFTLAWGAATLYALRAGRRLLAAGLLLLSALVPMSYGCYGVGTILLFALLENRPALCFYGQLFLTLAYSVWTGVWLQLAALFAFAFLGEKRGQAAWRLPRYTFYVFYPAHLLVLCAVRQLCFA